ncbi:MAG: sensor hybrid histidine kinase [Myxococcaceae bacterium]|nr:sensor hybrid histidine kinase [Myxococcaceae bacterium]
MRTSPQNPSQDPLFAGPGEIRARCRAIDWSATALGPAADWPRSLRLAVRMCLGARFPMTVWAGPELVLIYNERYPAVLGSDRHPWALGRPAREVWPELWDRLGPELEQVIQHGESTHHDDERFVLRREGEEEEAWFTYSFTPIQEEDGRVVGALNAFLETTERVRPLTERTALLHAISDSLPDRIFAKDLRGRVLFANPAMLAAVGRPAEQVLGKTDLEFLDDKDAARRLMENDRRVMESGSPIEVEEHLPLPDGTRRVWHSVKSAYRDDRGRIIGLLGISRDVTERTRAAEVLRGALEEAELERRRLMAVLEALPSGIAIADADGKLIQTNAALDRIWGSPPKSTRLKDYAQWRGRWVDTGEPVAPGEWALARALESGEIVSSGRVEIEKCDGSGLATITQVAAPIRDGEGRTVGGVVVVVDTTEQRRVEEAVRASEEGGTSSRAPARSR